MIHGIDLSSHNDPDWSQLDYVRFCMIRATMGAHGIDERCHQHTTNCGRRGVRVGYYHLFRPEHSWQSQFDNFAAQMFTLGYGRVNHICPAIDVERVSTGEPSPEWVGPLRELYERMSDYFGNVMLYMSPSDWVRLGKPKLSGYLGWIAHWGRKPMEPGFTTMDIAMHQHAVCVPGLPVKHQDSGAGRIDHNVVMCEPPRLR